MYSFIYFRFSLHSASILKKIESQGLSFDKIMIRTKENLKASGDFGIAIFDNSQLIEQLKFQRNAKSSLVVTLTTSRCFLKPMLPTNMGDINFGDEKVPIIYLTNQTIPSPYNFPAFEMENTISKTSFFPTYLAVTDSIDLSGERVEAYCCKNEKDHSLLNWAYVYFST